MTIKGYQRRAMGPYMFQVCLLTVFGSRWGPFPTQRKVNSQYHWSCIKAGLCGEEPKKKKSRRMPFWQIGYMPSEIQHFQPTADSAAVWGDPPDGARVEDVISRFDATVSDIVRDKDLCNLFCHMFGKTTMCNFCRPNVYFIIYSRKQYYPFFWTRCI